MTNFRFFLKNVATTVACFAVCMMFSGCDKPTTSEEKGTEALFKSFSFTGIDGKAEIDKKDLTITAKAGKDVDLTKIAPTFKVSDGAKVKVGSKTQESGETVNNFTNPVDYIVISEDGKTENTWTVTITKDGGGGPVTSSELTSAMINQPNATLARGTYQVKSSLTISSGNKLTIAAGTTIRFDQNTSLTVASGATLIAKGTQALPITFTSSQASPKEGDWRGVYINQDGSEFEWCIFEYGSGQSASYGMLYLNNCKASIKNCTFRNSQFSGIFFNGANSGFSAFENNTLKGCGEKEDDSSPIKVGGNADLSELDNISNDNNIETGKGITVDGGSITKNTTFKALAVPYLITRTLVVKSGFILTIEAGATLKFATNISLDVELDAKIIAKGTSGKNITFTSAMVVATAQPGDWRAIYIKGRDSEFEWCVFEYGSGQSANYGMLYVDNCKLSVKNCTFRNSRYSGIYFYGASSGFTAFENNTMTNCGENENESYPIKIGSSASLAAVDGFGNGNNITTAKGIGVGGGNITQNTTLKNLSVPYLFTGKPVVTSTNTLTIEPGATLKFAKSQGIDVQSNAKIIANGTSGKPITFTSAVVVTNAQPGDWNGIYLYGKDNEFNECVFEYGSGQGNGWGMLYLDNATASFTNCTFRHSKYSAIYLYRADSRFTAFDNNKMTNCGETEADSYPIKVGTSANLSCMGDLGENEITTAKGIGVSGGTVPRNVTIKAYVHYLFYGHQTVNNGAVLTIEPGATLKFDNNGGARISLEAGAKIIADGTAAPITFTSARANKAAGDWQGIYIYSNDSDFKNCIFEYGSSQSNGWGMLYLDNAKASFTGCTFRHAKYNGIYLYRGSSGFTAFDNNKISDCGEDEAESYPIKAGISAGIMSLSGMGGNNTITSTKGIGINGSTVNADLTLRKYLYTVYGGTISISQTGTGATLTILPGAELRFAQGLSLRVEAGGKLIAEGNSTNKIIFTGSAKDKGWWNGIIFDNNSALSGSVLNYCDISYGGRGTGAGNNGNISCYAIRSGVLTVKNCNITHSRAWGIYVQTGPSAASPTIENNNTYANNGQNNNSDVGSTVIGNY